MITSACFTLERALAVCDPLKSMRLCTRNKSIKICLASWLASFVYNVCVGIMKLAVYSHLPGQLVIFNDSLFLVDLTLFYFAPFVLSTICYWKILRALRARAKLFLQGAVNGFNPNTAQGNRQNNSGNHTDSSRLNTSKGYGRQKTEVELTTNGPICKQQRLFQKRTATEPSLKTDSTRKDMQNDMSKNPKKEQTHQHLSANRKVTRLMFMIMLSFLLLLSPHRLWNLTHLFAQDMASFKTNQLISQIVSIVYICNSIVNPIICCFASEIYRQQLMVTYFGRRKPSPAGLSQANTNTTNHHLRKQSSNVFTGGSEHRKNCESTNFEASQV
ncbi:uncharacterized protein LOC142350244 [Convolutriloba macropyga]|uniref:uncharacterized protein LOC142350244 n=1 Tax=Convolutriloba macropyga TaxID=536237 RepID=UPI003F5290E4